MRRRSVFVMVLLFLPAFSPLIRAAEKQWLNYGHGVDRYDKVGGLSYNHVPMSADKPADVKYPEFKSEKPLFASWKSPLAPGGQIRIALDSIQESGNYDVMYLDKNGNGDLTDDEPIKASNVRGYERSFGRPACVLLDSEDGPIEYHIHFKMHSYDANDRSLYALTSGWYEGQIELAGKMTDIVLVDGNCNGVFNEKNERDDLRYKDNGQWIERVPAKYVMIRGKLYCPEISRDGAQIALTPATDVKFGKVKMVGGVTGAVFVGSNGIFDDSPKDGIATLPEGTYRLRRWTVEKSESSSKWRMSAYNYRNPRTVKVSVKADAEIEVGQGIRANLNYNASRNTFDQSLTDTNGYNITIDRAGRSRENPPKLVIRNQDETYMKRLTFEYG